MWGAGYWELYWWGGRAKRKRQQTSCKIVSTEHNWFSCFLCPTHLPSFKQKALSVIGVKYPVTFHIQLRMVIISLCFFCLTGTAEVATCGRVQKLYIQLYRPHNQSFFFFLFTSQAFFWFCSDPFSMVLCPNPH